MSSIIELLAHHPAYPTRLRGRRIAPPALHTQGGSLEAELVVAVVGSRRAHEVAEAYARRLARDIVRTGAVVASGGAVGIDAAAHRGALCGRGRTWVVAGTGCKHVFPAGHARLYARIARGPGAMLWPFPPDTPGTPKGATFLRRNRVLVALADVVVVVQAGEKSGALHTAGCALRAGKPLWVAVPPPPFVEKGFEGSLSLLKRGARPLTSTADFLEALTGQAACATAPALSSRPLSDAESALLGATSTVPLHIDEIAARAHASAQAASAALLTLALENVVVEGPPGFFRRRDAPNT